MSRWAVCLPMSSLDALGPLRLLEEIEVCQQCEELWLQGRALDEALEVQLRSLSGAERYSVLSDGQLLKAGRRVPQGRLPHGDWQPLSTWLRVELPPTVWGGQLQGRAPLELVRSDAEQEANVLRTTLEHWQAYAARAPQVRLDQWYFAVASDAAVVIRGRPLPPLPGVRWVECEGVAIRCGWTLDSCASALVVRRMLGLGPGDLAFVEHDGSWELVSSGDFVRAARSAVRWSTEDLQRG